MRDKLAQVVRNKGAEGVDGMKYTELREHLVKNGEIIKEQLRTRKYKPQPVRRVEIPKPDGGVRNLEVPTVTDRFVQQAIAQVLTPIYEEQFHAHSYGFRPNRCAQQAILTALDMMNDGNEWGTDEFVSETVDDYGEVTVEEKKYYEKVGEKEEKVISGYHQEQVGTKKVKVGSHKEKIGTKKVKNSEREGFLGFFKVWKPKYVDEAVYESVDDYEDQAVYETVTDYETVMRDVFAERTERIEKYSVAVDEIQTGLVSQYHADLDGGIQSARKYAKNQIDDMKSQFTGMFADLDRLIQEKYDELDKAANDQKIKEEELQKNKKLLSWIEACQAEIDEALSM